MQCTIIDTTKGSFSYSYVKILLENIPTENSDDVLAQIKKIFVETFHMIPISEVYKSNGSTNMIFTIHKTPRRHLHHNTPEDDSFEAQIREFIASIKTLFSKAS